MKILVIDDESDVLMQVENAVKSWSSVDASREVNSVDNYKKILEGDKLYDIVITDMVMGENEDEGLQVLNDLRARSAVLVVLTQYPSIPNCVKAMKAGAWDYIEKNPEDGSDPYERLCESVKKACDYLQKNPERGTSNPDSLWAYKHLDELMKKFPGKLVAVLYERVVDSGDNVIELSERVKKKFPLTEPTIVSVPDPERREV